MRWLYQDNDWDKAHCARVLGQCGSDRIGIYCPVFNQLDGNHAPLEPTAVALDDLRDDSGAKYADVGLVL